MSEPVDDLTYWIDPPTPVERFFAEGGAWEGNVDFVVGDDHSRIPMVLVSDGQGHGFGVKREMGES